MLTSAHLCSCIHTGGSEDDSECPNPGGQTDGSARKDQTEEPLRQTDYCIPLNRENSYHSLIAGQMSYFKQLIYFGVTLTHPSVSGLYLYFPAGVHAPG